MRYKVLLVDDDPSVLGSLSAAIEFDLHVQVCGSAERALQLLQDGEFHVVCSDYAIPGMNGLELFKQVAKLATPVACLLLTPASFFEGRSAPLDQYVLTKPIAPGRLSSLLLQLARTAEMKRQAARPGSAPKH
jgi:DNA-binding NtrC family response regulator